MRKLKYTTRVLLVAVVVMWAIVVIGAIENYFNNPVRGCRKYDASTNYWGYECAESTKYIQK